MLTEDEKNRIRFEEVFREEVRNELKNQQSRSLLALLWKVLNSSFALWFLGSVAVGLIVFYKDAADKESKRANLEGKLNVEVANRVDRLRFYLRSLESMGTLMNFKDVLRSTGPVREQPWPMGVFSEYANRTLESLLWEISLTVKSQKERELILAALHASRRIRAMEGEVKMQTPEKDKQRYIERVYEELDNNFELTRWKLP